MGIFKKVRDAVSSSANTALDKALDPKRELDVIIADLDAQRTRAIKELLSYKTTAKQMEESLAVQEKQGLLWQKRAMIAVKAGDDETAKKCLQRKRESEIECRNIKRDQHEANGYAVELNNSRKILDVKLRMLKLRKGTMATQIAAARNGASGDPFAASNTLFEKLEAAERQIDDECFAEQAKAELQADMGDSTELDRELLSAVADLSDSSTSALADDPLTKLKEKMAEENQSKKQLKS